LGLLLFGRLVARFHEVLRTTSAPEDRSEQFLPHDRLASALVGDVDWDPADDDDFEDDPLRAQLLDAAAQVFASKGYYGTKIMDIVKAAGLSSGAVYGRFASKDELLMEAILRHVEDNVIGRRLEGKTAAEALIEASRAEGPLDDVEAMQLEAFIAARKQPNIAAAIAENREQFRVNVLNPLIERAIADGGASPDEDFDSVIYFVETLLLGLLVQRGAGHPIPDNEAWQRFLGRLIRTIGRPPPSG
jgi:AcrR family transcriptional regulator